MFVQFIISTNESLFVSDHYNTKSDVQILVSFNSSREVNSRNEDILPSSRSGIVFIILQGYTTVLLKTTSQIMTKDVVTSTFSSWYGHLCNAVIYKTVKANILIQGVQVSTISKIYCKGKWKVRWVEIITKWDVYI